MQDTRPEWLGTEEYPFELSTVRLSAGDVAYVDVGDGPMLLFVHAGMWSFVFRDVIQRLQSDFRCVTLDFPGYGLSAPADAELTTPGMADLLEEFVDRLDLTDVTLVVHDLGGPVGLAAAARAPSRYAGIVLANTFAWTPDTPGLRAMMRIVSNPLITSIDVATNLVPRLTSTRFGVGRSLDRSDRAAFLGPFRDRAVRRRFHEAMRTLIAHPEFTDAVEVATRTSLAALPVLSVFGEGNDPFGFQPRHEATFGDHEGVIVPRGNHFPMMDDPELFVSSLRDWHSRKVDKSAYV